MTVSVWDCLSCCFSVSFVRVLVFLGGEGMGKRFWFWKIVGFCFLFGGGWLLSLFRGWELDWDLMRYCFACSERCSEIGRTCVSSCRCCMLVSCVQPVAIRRALFWIVCNLLVLVSDMMGDQMVDAYSRRGRVIVLYVDIMVSFCCPQVVDVREARMLSVLLAFLVMLLMWVVNVCCVSRVTPRIFVSFVVFRGWLLMCRLIFLVCSCGSGVERVSWVFVGFMWSLFCSVQW